jgi:hypothetical protein
MDLPEAKHMVGPDGTHYAAFTMEQYDDLIKIYAGYIALGDFCLAAIFEIGELNIQIDAYKQEVLSYEVANELLKADNKKYKLANGALELKLSKNKRTNFLKTLGVSTLVGLGTGLIGLGVGKAL